jgi:hypothetical protein
MVASIDVLPPAEAARNFEGYDGDVMRPGSTPLVLCAVRLHCHDVSLPHDIRQWRKIAPGCAGILCIIKRSEKNDGRTCMMRRVPCIHIGDHGLAIAANCVSVTIRVTQHRIGI